MRRDLLALMRRTGDPFTEAFGNRENKNLAAAVLTNLKSDFSKVLRPKPWPHQLSG